MNVCIMQLITFDLQQQPGLGCFRPRNGQVPISITATWGSTCQRCRFRPSNGHSYIEIPYTITLTQVRCTRYNIM